MIAGSNNGLNSRVALTFFALVFISTHNILSHADDGNDNTGLEILTEAISAHFSNFITVFNDDIMRELGFCIDNLDAEWNAAFNFSKKSKFLAECIRMTKGWACSVGRDKKVDLKNSKDIPTRLEDCQPCCEGFFCPRGLPA